MSNFTPTPEQRAIVEFAATSSENMIVSALAGAAKTSTLILIAEALAPQSILCLAFNKKIRDEMVERLPPNCDALTLNSLGHRAWGGMLGRRLVLEKSKNYTILKELIEALPTFQKELAFEAFTDYQRLFGFAKQCGWVPDASHPRAKRLMTDAEFFGHGDYRLEDWEEDLLRRAMLRSLDMALDGIIDFDDQILMPTLFGASFPVYPVVMVDEAQDLSAINHAMLAKLVRKNRLIAVGDACQAIYGFRGAHQDSMDLLKEKFRMTEKILSVSFRCPTAVVTEARWRAPHMQWPDWAKPGSVVHASRWSLDSIPEGAVILCRNNAPLFGLAVKFFAAGRYAELVGNDIGKTLLRTLRKLGRDDTPVESVLFAIDEYEQQKLRRVRDKGKVADEVTCLRILASKGTNLGQILAHAEQIMNMKGSVKLMTGHKSKGLEFEDVYILDRRLLRLDRADSQDNNLLYVMQTRSKDRLTYLSPELFEGGNEDA